MTDQVEALWWLHRPDIYKRWTPELGTGQLHVLWQRNGPTGYVKLGFQHHRARWTTLTAPPPTEPEESP
jgi:replicative DNA helicase